MSVAAQAVRGAAWNLLFGVGSRILQLVGTLFLTRFIAPDDYGAVLTASIAVATAGGLTSFAFGQHLIAKRAAPEVAFQALVVHFGLGVVAMAAVYAIRVPLGVFLDTPSMSQYVYAYAIAHLIERARYIPERVLTRALRFRTIASVNGAGELAYTATALATAGRWGANAILFGVLVRAVLTAVLYFRFAPRKEWWAPTRLRLADIGDLFSYGLPIMIGGLVDRGATRWDNLIMAKLFDPGVMGRYNLSFSLAETPVSNVAEQIGDVLMPSFSRMERAERLRVVVRTPLLIGVIVSPLGVGLGAVSSTLVSTFFDERWAGGMAPMLAILSVMTVARPMIWSANAYLLSEHKTRLVMLASFLRAILVLMLCAVCGALGGPLWACAGASLGYVTHGVLTIVAASRVIGFSVGEYLAGVARPLLPCTPMLLAVLGVQHLLAHTALPGVVSLALQVGVGGLVYLGAAFILMRSTVDEVIRLGRQAIGR